MDGVVLLRGDFLQRGSGVEGRPIHKGADGGVLEVGVLRVQIGDDGFQSGGIADLGHGLQKDDFRADGGVLQSGDDGLRGFFIHAGDLRQNGLRTFAEGGAFRLQHEIENFLRISRNGENFQSLEGGFGFIRVASEHGENRSALRNGLTGGENFRQGDLALLRGVRKRFGRDGGEFV